MQTGECRSGALGVARSYLMSVWTTETRFFVDPRRGQPMGRAELDLSDLRRLQQALENIASDLDEIEGRSHARLRDLAKNLHGSPRRSLEACMSNFEIAVRGRLAN